MVNQHMWSLLVPRTRCLACRLFPAFQTIRYISKVLAARVAEHMIAAHVGTAPPGAESDWEAYVVDSMWTADQLAQ